MSKDLPSVSELRKLLSCNFDSGELVWKPRPGKSSFNAQVAGRPAFTSTDKDGYRKGSINKKHLRAHRVIWAMWNGRWPVGQVDHINGDRADNRIVNLREATQTDNQRNRKRGKNNTSGVIGVRYREGIGRWSAEIKVNGKKLHIANCGCITAAMIQRKLAEKRYGFHKNHGRG